jgi:hypothetical protein
VLRLGANKFAVAIWRSDEEGERKNKYRTERLAPERRQIPAS